MKQFSHWFLTATARYALFGVLFGCCFPIVATAADLLVQGLQLTITNGLWVQKQQPLHWIIDTAPLFLGLFAAFAGRRQDLLTQFSDQLEEEIVDRTVELLKSNQELMSQITKCRGAEKRSQEIFDAAPDAMVVINKDGTIVSVNSRAEKMFGYTREELLGETIETLVPERFRSKHRGHRVSYFAHPHMRPMGVGLDLLSLRKDGSEFPVEISLSPLESENGMLIIGVIRNITERKRAEETLRESEARYRDLVETAQDAVFTVSPDGMFASLNPVFETLTNWSRTEWLGQPFALLVHPDDLPLALELFQRLLQGETPPLSELRVISKSGASHTWEFTATPQFREGKVVGILVIARDTTEHKRAELELERLRHQQELILQSVADGIQVLDFQGKATFVNPAAVRMIGYEVEELIGRSMHDTLHHSKPDGTPYPRAECPISRTLTDDTLCEVTDEVFWRKDSTSFPVEYISAPMREDDKIAGAVVTFRDISERRAVERMKDEFVSVVSHELRTPLTSIRGALGLLTSGLIGALPERGQRMLEIAVNNTDRLVRLINDILDIERMQSGKVTMQRQLCDAATLLTQASEEMQGMADKAGVRLAVTPQTLRLWADPDRIVQTLTNLLSNAIKFSPPHTRVELSTARRGEEAVFAVQDQGRGIPADKLESIFERFQQVDASDSRQKGGTGLGLAICRSIVQRTGGGFGWRVGRAWAAPFTSPYQCGKRESSHWRGRWGGRWCWHVTMIPWCWRWCRQC